MNIRCPVCRADNTTGSTCRRCRADLSLLAAVEARRTHHLMTAATDIRSGCFDVALEELQRAQELRPGGDICQERACAFLLAADFASALVEYASASGGL